MGMEEDIAKGLLDDATLLEASHLLDQPIEWNR